MLPSDPLSRVFCGFKIKLNPRTPSGIRVVASFPYPSLWIYLEPDLGRKIAFVFGAVLVFCRCLYFFMIPETKVRTCVEIDELWDRSILGRKFKETKLVSVVE